MIKMLLTMIAQSEVLRPQLVLPLLLAVKKDEVNADPHSHPVVVQDQVQAPAHLEAQVVAVGQDLGGKYNLILVVGVKASYCLQKYL